ncbi:hypothetical protein [Sulfurovum sp.]|uniref:hypothetical protein n=1 Tax=Sulfurovum sp. TaxID=1969726 RepID=UPI0025E66A39|nr:hypothetical protein [Sulfurovum sp.]
MKLLQYFFGIVIAQIALFALVLLNAGTLTTESLLRIGVPALFIALVIAFWFNSIAKHHSKDVVSKVKDEFINEREKIRINAERAKMRVHKEAEKKIIKETTKAHAKANFKVGAAFAGLIGVGALFVMAQMVTAGLLMISASAGAMGGYYLRSKRDKYQALPTIEVKPLEQKPKKLESKGK